MHKFTQRPEIKSRYNLKTPRPSAIAITGGPERKGSPARKGTRLITGSFSKRRAEIQLSTTELSATSTTDDGRFVIELRMSRSVTQIRPSSSGSPIKGDGVEKYIFFNIVFLEIV